MSETSKQSVIDHPAQPGWRPGGSQAISHRLETQLHRRFSASGEDAAAVMQAVDLASMQLDAYRITHERDSLGRLQLSPSEQQLYERLAGRPNRFGAYIRWFGRVATRALLYVDHTYPFDSVALELAGVRQLGDWGATKELDVAVRRVPEQLHLFSPSIAVSPAVLGPSNYQLRPMYDDETRNYSFRYAAVRRRQPAFDVQEQSQEQVRLYRQSVGLLVLSQLAPDARRSIVEAYEAAGPEQSAANNTPVAALAGQVFEQAITDRAGLAIVPVATQYIMRMVPGR